MVAHCSRSFLCFHSFISVFTCQSAEPLAIEHTVQDLSLESIKKNPHRYPHLKSLLNKGNKDYSSCEKFLRGRTKQKPAEHEGLQPSVLLIAICQGPSFVTTLWGEQLYCCTGRKRNHPSSEISGKYSLAMRAYQDDSKEQRWLKADKHKRKVQSPN